jgi:hypothetical protein
MKKTLFTIFSISIITSLLLLSSCEEKSEFTDALTLGTGMSGFTITGESSSFTQTSGSVVIYYRLESEEDMAGRTAVLDFETSSGSLINTITRPQAQDYGHIQLSSFEWLGSTGTFVMKAYLADGVDKIFIAEKEFTIN